MIINVTLGDNSLNQQGKREALPGDIINKLFPRRHVDLLCRAGVLCCEQWNKLVVDRNVKWQI